MWLIVLWWAFFYGLWLSTSVCTLYLGLGFLVYRAERTTRHVIIYGQVQLSFTSCMGLNCLGLQCFQPTINKPFQSNHAAIGRPRQLGKLKENIVFARPGGREKSSCQSSTVQHCCYGSLSNPQPQSINPKPWALKLFDDIGWRALWAKASTK